MDAAAAALNKFISGQPKSDSKTEQDTSSSVKASSAETSSAETASANTTVDTTTAGADDTTVEQEIAPAVEHETVKHFLPLVNQSMHSQYKTKQFPKCRPLS
ncbi:unnamed protein product [Zymoseptoria tritici ST99CH_1A5]|uniref:Uncharacterized protein n=1 Tax=Zymoseptoria tritici ST99CH_1A5 TaxID=1276529 RepID=A0A1Y6LFG6_ZYMTR|nr:unnamed protein product [Zymoseptoria tritici ST99CH_1A5]